MYNDLSLPWQNENEDIQKMSEPIPFIEFGFEKEERCLPTEFKILCFMTQSQYHVQKLYKNCEQFQFNRNASFMTFDPSRVTLGPAAERDKPENYINANFIEVEGKRVIATQGPLTTTFYNFWRMVEQYNCRSIFMLCNLIEKNKIKCDRYFPCKDQEGAKMAEKEYEVTLLHDDTKDHLFPPKELKLEADPDSHKAPHKEKKHPLKVRKYELKNTETQKSMVFTHYQMIDWTDGDKPQKQSKKHLNFLVGELIASLTPDSVPLVHCSAGVGRTGTFIAMAHIRLLVEKGEEISVFNETRKFKEQRWGLVYTLSQYEYLYEWTERQINKKLKNGAHSMSEESSDEEI